MQNIYLFYLKINCPTLIWIDRTKSIVSGYFHDIPSDSDRGSFVTAINIDSKGLLIYVMLCERIYKEVYQWIYRS